MQPSDPLIKHFRLTPTQQSGLKRLGIRTLGELLRHFPARYDRGGASATIAGAVAGTEATLFGTLEKLETRKSWKRRIPVGEATLRDATGTIKIMWFHQPYIAKKFSEGAFVKAVGAIGGKDGKVYLANPHVELADPMDADVGLFTTPEVTEEKVAQMFAVNPESKGVTSLWFRHAIERLIQSGILSSLPDPLPADVCDRYHLPELATALHWIHIPENDKHAEAARKRFAFEEIFALHVIRAMDRAENNTQKAFSIPDAEAHIKKFLSTVPFPPTGAQARALTDISADVLKPHPMARLLEGDVGAGKTLVAAASAYAVVNARPPGRTSGTLQVAYMAPTEILATQHFESFTEYFKDLPINIALITGSGCKKFPSKASKEKSTSVSRAQLLKWVGNGEIAMLIGTHAIIQKSVQFKHLAYAIVDEQHRFGTKQRQALARKGDASPHFLSMTATPIPRTLALTIYGDLDLSVLDELPPGRAKITTRIVKPSDRKEVYEAMRTALKEGRQAYVICPRIDEPDPEKETSLLAKSVTAEAERLARDVFPEYSVDILHGAMKPAEKDEVMKDFAAGKTHILVATSVVEVGINVPNATMMLIEGAERFGLAQLHQLRGRIMRSSHPPTCFLLPETRSTISLQRLRTLEKSSDGFALAEADLAARGSGDLYGRKQWGVSDIGMEALKNPKLIAAAHTEAVRLVASDPTLTKHAPLKERVLFSQLHSE